MKRNSLLLSLFSLVLITLASCSKDDDDNINTNVPNATDNNFMAWAAHYHLSEAELGELALTSSANDSVKMFAQMMVTDHNAWINSLDSAAVLYSFQFPDAPDSARAAFKVQLSGLVGYDFDTAYINSRVRDHQWAAQLYQNVINNGNAASVKAHATRILPAIQLHQQRADSIAAFIQ
jgi:putative membrane protein